jgi:hypothetical protein
MPKLTEGTFALGGLAAFAIWFAVVLPFLYGPSSHSSEQKHVAAEQSAQSTNAKPDGSTAAPFVVQVIPGPKSAEERSQEAEDREEKKIADRWLVRWTAALFAATVGLILATGVLGYFGLQQSRDMKESIRSAEKSAVAAENSVAITLATQKAKLEITRFEQQSLSGIGSLIGFTISALWKNFGNLTALRMNLNLQVRFVAPEDVANLTFTVRKHPETKDNLAPGNEVSTSPIPIRPDQAVDCWQKKLRIFVFSQASYNDMIELHGPQRLISDHCSEVIFQIDPNLMLLPTAGVGPFSAQMVRYSGYRVEIEEGKALVSG